jgi:hypothetical protein
MPFSLKDPKELLAVYKDEPLSSPHIHVGLGTATLDQPFAVKAIGATFSVGLDETTEIQGFNSPDDTDEDGVVGPRQNAGDDGTLAPLLTVDGQENAWLKYRVDVQVKADAGVDLPYVSPSLEGQREVVIADYRRHNRTELLRGAIEADIPKLRLPFVAGELAEIRVGDAATYQARGKLKASLGIKWTDAFTSNLSLLTQLVPGGGLLGIETDVGASLTASVTFSDDFILAFTRVADDTFRVAVRKAKTSERDVTFKVGAEVALTSVKEQLNSILDALVKVAPFSRFEGWLKAQPTNPEEQKLLTMALQRLGWSTAPAATWSDAWTALKKKAADALAQLANEKVEAAFSYEYSRLEDTSTLLQFTAPLHTLQENLGALLQGKLDEVGSKNGVTLERYLRQDKSVFTQAWGFSLSLGKWELLGQDKKELTKVVQYNRPPATGVVPQQKISFLGVRQYTGKLLDWEGSWTVDFKADMDHFVTDPTAANLSYGLHLLLKRGALSGDALDRAIDEALQWRVFGFAKRSEVAAALTGKDVKGSRLELKFEDRAVRALLKQAASLDKDHLARALARALPWANVEARRTPMMRVELYAPLWRAYLDQNWSANTAADTVAATLKDRLDEGTLYDEHRHPSGNPSLSSFADMVYNFSDTIPQWNSFHEGFNSWADAVAQGQSPAKLSDAFEAMQEFWAQSFHVKALGSLLLEVGAAGASGLAGIERTWTVSLGTTEKTFSTSA